MKRQKRQKNGKTERQKDRKTERKTKRQKEQKSERKKDKKTKRQTDKKTKGQKDLNTKRQIYKQRVKYRDVKAVLQCYCVCQNSTTSNTDLFLMLIEMILQ